MYIDNIIRYESFDDILNSYLDDLDDKKTEYADKGIPIIDSVMWDTDNSVPPMRAVIAGTGLG